MSDRHLPDWALDRANWRVPSWVLSVKAAP